MASLSLKHIFKVYDGSVKAVNDFSMEIADREFIVFVGPSGCGKSTTLRMIAGLEDITAGELRIDDEIVNDYEPKDRNIAMVFQNYALYPHMSVYENMAFSLRNAKVPAPEIREKVLEAAEILGITEYLERKPRALSGGQRQRVALGRALVRRPKVFLLDEPLSNLDAKLRAAMRAEISLLHEKLGTTFIYVTHDQVEAMTMGDRIVVMKGGCIQQIDTPMGLYRHPDNLFVAGFIGTPQINLFDATAKRRGETVTVTFACGSVLEIPFAQMDTVPLKYLDGAYPLVYGIRPDAVRLAAASPQDGEGQTISAVVRMVEALGGETLIYANLNENDPEDERGKIVLRAEPDIPVHRGEKIQLTLSYRQFHLFDRESERNLRCPVPKNNLTVCELSPDALLLGEQSIPLPPALAGKKGENAELVIPSHAVTVGQGTARARVRRVETLERGQLVILEIGDQILFAITESTGGVKAGEKVTFDLDLRRASIAACDVAPLPNESAVDATLKKQRATDGKGYEFYFETAGGTIPAPEVLCHKLFACKGTAIFRTRLSLQLPREAMRLCDGAMVGTLHGQVREVMDYGAHCYVRVAIGGQEVTLSGRGAVGETVFLTIDGGAITVKDAQLDMIIA